jgi:hypothetical protein
MSELTLIRRVVAMVAIIVGAILAFAAGLAVMNIRADWAVVLGALVCLAAPLLAGARLWSMMKEHDVQ